MDKALETQLANIAKRTGKSLAELHDTLRTSGLTKHGELVALLKTDLGMGHGDANTVVHLFRSPQPEGGAGADLAGVVDGLYAGPKAALRPIHDAVMAAIARFGTFETAPKKTYLSLRRKKQFAMVGPGTRGRFEVGLNMKGVAATERLVAQTPGGMCQYKVFLSTTSEIDRELLDWIRVAYDSAG
jgi:hypothetical protein